jgi:hypothetical protein
MDLASVVTVVRAVEVLRGGLTDAGSRDAEGD